MHGAHRNAFNPCHLYNAVVFEGWLYLSGDLQWKLANPRQDQALKQPSEQRRCQWRLLSTPLIHMSLFPIFLQNRGIRMRTQWHPSCKSRKTRTTLMPLNSWRNPQESQTLGKIYNILHIHLKKSISFGNRLKQHITQKPSTSSIAQLYQHPYHFYVEFAREQAILGKLPSS